MKFKLFPYIKRELYQLKNIDKEKYIYGNVYLEIKVKRLPGNNNIFGVKPREYYSKGFFNKEQIAEILNLTKHLADNKYITEIEIELERGE